MKQFGVAFLCGLQSEVDIIIFMCRPFWVVHCENGECVASRCGASFEFYYVYVTEF